MIHYVKLGKKERPFTLVYSVPYDYQLENPGRFYNTDISELVAQMLNATAALTETQKRISEMKETDYVEIIGLISKANSVALDMVLLIKIFYTALKVGHRIEKVPFDLSERDVADLTCGDSNVIATFTTALFEANFNFPKASENGVHENDEPKKKRKAPAR